jgi:hypothetical protein
MWERIRRELLIEYYWWRRHTGKKRGLDSPVGVVGILLIISGIFLMTIIGQGFASLFRNMMPLVSGTQVAGAYWSSVIFALKVSIALMVFMISIVIFLFLKFSSNRRK